MEKLKKNRIMIFTRKNELGFNSKYVCWARIEDCNLIINFTSGDTISIPCKDKDDVQNKFNSLMESMSDRCCVKADNIPTFVKVDQLFSDLDDDYDPEDYDD